MHEHRRESTDKQKCVKKISGIVNAARAIPTNNNDNSTIDEDRTSVKMKKQ